MWQNTSQNLERQLPVRLKLRINMGQSSISRIIIGRQTATLALYIPCTPGPMAAGNLARTVQIAGLGIY